jgi:DNA processing protein
MFSKNELRCLLALQRVPNLGDASIKKLINHIGSAEGIFKEKIRDLQKIEGISAFRLKDFSPKIVLDEAEEELKFIAENNIRCHHFLESEYPAGLKHCIDSPIVIFSKGNFNLNNKYVISIVGTRNATSHGKKACETLISELAPLKPVIVSGFAYGIDIVAHKAALKQGLQTIVCLAHGLNQIYPKTHYKYVPQILENGALFTEFWSSDPFDRTNFLKRNRIIAGMSEATVVIESAEKGGSLVTADIANSYNRDVFAMPGRTTDALSRGCNNLIKTQQAHLLSSAADLVYLMGWDLDKKRETPVQTELFFNLNEEEERVYNFLRDNEKELLDHISIKCKLPSHKTATVLFNLEIKGLVRPLPGKLFQVT